MSTRVVSIVGARPQFVKLAPLSRAFARCDTSCGGPIEHIIVHTGQHYDAEMSDIFFAELEIPAATVNLNVGSGRHGHQAGQMLERVETALLEIEPDMVVTYGDTNSTLAGALAAAKLHIPNAHVEAGLRSFNRRMPEEINRLVADHVADLLLAPTATAVANLEREGLSDRTVLTGDVMYDAVLSNRALAEQPSGILRRLSLASGDYGVVTLHRAENTDDAERLEGVLVALNDIAASGLSLVFPMHPRTAKQLPAKVPGWAPHARLNLVPPVGYVDMLRLVYHARLTLTDSGGLQREAFFLGCPCITLRDETEWVETIRDGANVLTGVDPARIRQAFASLESRIPARGVDFPRGSVTGFGNGGAADRTVAALLDFLRRRNAPEQTATAIDGPHEKDRCEESRT
jgi:UDP-N-acetylglucosamine 2-epimerase